MRLSRRLKGGIIQFRNKEVRGNGDGDTQTIKDLYVSRGMVNLNLYIAHLSHKIYKSHGLKGHLVRQVIRRNLKKYAYSLSRR